MQQGSKIRWCQRKSPAFDQIFHQNWRKMPFVFLQIYVFWYLRLHLSPLITAAQHRTWFAKKSINDTSILYLDRVLWPGNGWGWGGCTAECWSLLNVKGVLIILHFPAAMNHWENLVVTAAKHECYFAWDPAIESCPALACERRQRRFGSLWTRAVLN